jgi:aspartyl-tRNA synthetase
MMRTHTAGELRAAHAGQRVTLCGWVQNRRDHGGLLFLDLRDRYGVTQVVVEPEADADARREADRVRLEWVVAATGTVRQRPEASRNLERATGEVEVVVESFRVLSAADPVPIALTGSERSSDELELRYRYLELRRADLRDALLTRARMNTVIRDHMTALDFVEVETPSLLKSTPEGARDYLVPSRVHPGHCYALLQSPQLLKQLLMVGGMDRYWQIVRCFRDEDLRADRQPEFTQLDVELSFADEADVQEVAESLVARLVREVAGVEVPRPFPHLTYAEAMERYGSDKPDLRYGLPVHDVSALVAGSAFGVFRDAVQSGGVVRALAVPAETGGLTRRDLDALPAVVADRGARGVAWCRVQEADWAGPAARHLVAEERDALRAATGAGPGGLLLFVAGPREVAVPATGDLRVHVARVLGLASPRDFRPVWIDGFPLFLWNQDEQRFEATHHPFTAPVEEDLPLLETDPLKVRSRGYDLALNGLEVLGGSIRIHDVALQRRVMRLLGLSDELVEERFGFFMEALRYGAPPHGGFACGTDRLAAVLTGRSSIRDVIAFPKTATAADLMTGAPSVVDPAQLAELGLRPAL